jgi:hypothetical protein
MGSSSLYFHNLPGQITRWYSQVKDVPAEWHFIGEPGTFTCKYLSDGYRVRFGLDENESLLEHLAEKPYDFVVILVACEGFGDKDEAAFDHAVAEYAKAIKSRGGTPVWVEHGWAREPDRNAVIDKGRDNLRKAVAEHGGILAPCRTAWDLVWADHDWDLNDLPDTVHPGKLGAYLNLCCLTLALTGSLPDPTPRVIEHDPLNHPGKDGGRLHGLIRSILSESTAAVLQQAAITSCRNSS